MGREIRKVPADWEHPKWTDYNAIRPELVGKLMPLYDEDYETASEKWLAEVDLWRTGEHSRQKEGGCIYKYYWEWNGGPPDKHSYRERKWTEAEATHFVVYETVSEGTPVTPSFATKDELIDHLINHGTAWDNGRGWPRENAEQFVSRGWAPSGIASPQSGFKTVNEPGFFNV